MTRGPSSLNVHLFFLSHLTVHHATKKTSFRKEVITTRYYPRHYKYFFHDFSDKLFILSLKLKKFMTLKVYFPLLKSFNNGKISSSIVIIVSIIKCINDENRRNILLVKAPFFVVSLVNGYLFLLGINLLYILFHNCLCLSYHVQLYVFESMFILMS